MFEAQKSLYVDYIQIGSILTVVLKTSTEFALGGTFLIKYIIYDVRLK